MFASIFDKSTELPTGIARPTLIAGWTRGRPVVFDHFCAQIDGAHR
jgi:hypothetical protein